MTATASTDRSRRVWVSAAAALASVAMLVPASGCDPGSPTRRPSTSPGVARPSPAPGPPSGPAGPGRYRVVDDLCAVAVLTALEDRFGTASTTGRLVTTRRGPTISFMHCAVALGSGPSGLAGLTAELVGTGTAEPMFRGLRGVQARSGPVTDLPGLGAGAYAYQDRDTGPHVVAYDGPLHLTVYLTPTAGATAAGTDLTPVLTEVCRATMTALREPA